MNKKEHTHDDTIAANVCLTLCLMSAIAIGASSVYSLVDGVHQTSVQRVNEIEAKVQAWQSTEMQNFEDNLNFTVYSSPHNFDYFNATTA